MNIDIPYIFRLDNYFKATVCLILAKYLAPTP